jgi:hypothetical protein
VFLIGDGEELKAAFEHETKAALEELVENLEVDITKEHLHLLPSLLWSLMGMNMLENDGLVHKCFTIIAEQMQAS